MEVAILKLLNWMSEAFVRLLNMSIAAGWLIMAVIALRLLFKRAPKWLTCTLWATVAVRLLCPFSIESSFSLIPSAETVPVQNIYSSDPSIADNPYYHQLQSGILQLDRAMVPVMTETKNGSAFRDNIALLAAFWIVGMLFMFLYAMVNFRRIRAMVREAVPLTDNIWICDAVKSPFILEIVRPRIYLPSSMEEEQLGYVLAHEQAHLKRRDHWWKPLGFLLLSVYWFHPLVWAAYILLCRDIEIACDEKVIKDMDMAEKKAYSNALVTCSIQRSIVLACPLAFGEVGVKKRVKTVLNYKKPAFWLIVAAILACVVVAVCFLTNPKNDTFDIKIVIPAGSEGATYYSEEEISPYRNKVTLSSGEGLGDTAVTLKPTEVTEENAYDEYTYMTPGMPVTIAAENGGWFQIGVVMSNPTDQDIIVYVQAKGVDVRIGDAAMLPDNTGETDDMITSSATNLFQYAVKIENDVFAPKELAFFTSIEEVLQITGLDADAVSEGGSGKRIISTVNIAGFPGDIMTIYSFSDDQLYSVEYVIAVDDTEAANVYDLLHEQAVSTMPVLTGNTVEGIKNGEEVTWEDKNKTYVRLSFPGTASTNTKTIILGMYNTERNMMNQNLDTDIVIGNLLETICSGPETSSNPYDYIDAHPIEYRELLYYGEYTLRYCFNHRFVNGNETGLDGKVMAIVCEELLQTEGSLPEDAATALTGQFWYDTLWVHSSNLVEPYLEYSETE